VNGFVTVARINPQHKCETCGNKHGPSSLVNKHIESTNVRLHQAVGFAAEIGYDVVRLEDLHLGWLV
jgi:hypothetical protein